MNGRMACVATLSVLAVVLVTAAAQNLNLRPIIGVLTEPIDPEMAKWGAKSFIAASYVKYIEMAGARVVPVPHDASADQLTALFNSLNGLLIPGGDVDLEGSDTYRTAKFFVQQSLTALQQGDYFPIHGTCMGFQTLSIIGAGDDFALLTRFDSENISLPLTFAPGAMTSRMFANASADVLKILQTQNVTMNNHNWGVSLANYQQNSKLNTFFRLLSVNEDRQGQTFVSAVEARAAPIYGTQFHPEKPMFEWASHTAVNHGPDAVEANQYFANFFVNECRKSRHTFPSADAEAAALIYNYNATYTYTPGQISYTQCYFF